MDRPDRLALVALEIADPPDRWRALGFTVGEDGCVTLGGIELRLGVSGLGITGWAVTCAPGLGTALGLRLFDAPAEPHANGTGTTVAHANGATGLDHLVITVPDFDATATALTRAGLPFRRVRQASETVRQGFRRLGPAILEVVEAPEAGAPAFWGLVVIVPDLGALEALAAPHVKSARPAVQPGRRIAPVSRSAGLSTQLAFMDPDPGGPA